MAAPANGLWRRRWVLAGVASAIVGAHAWGLGAVGGAAARQAEPPATARPAPFTVRSLAAQALPVSLAQPVAAEAAAPATAPAPAAPRAAQAQPAAPEQAEPEPEPLGPVSDADARPQPLAELPQTEATEVPAPPPPAEEGPSSPPPGPDGGAVAMAAATGAATAAAAAPAAARAETVQVPVYATRLAAPFSARYQLKRGMLSGSGTLRWSPSADGSRYEARLDGSVAGFNVLDWNSTGAIDRAGVAPERFLIRRRGKDAQAANFQRAAGKITYSGPSVQFDLPPGAQDRLSWMLQIGGVLNAAPKRFNVGSRIVFFVSGARGDADVWQFSVAGLESVALGGGRETLALKLVREPRKAYDTHVEIWLDPAKEHRPVKARLSTSGNDDALELLPMD
ncbi:DUF3108 domain-containing protein [Aquincola tertiaricarbonis]|uniref:DUF3108 domain-containing protein n=1 Tax=Aquincola tertiaricarbonis TaxID=391953 RepID=A0ABY4SAJ6_AQUTE|nr:DUF3108 domain-containing protein [Aquincola tertiaricarbonis]URI10009.1 DUF3108 domain-containing protein [Aquincola tertiaricarbonis]